MNKAFANTKILQGSLYIFKSSIIALNYSKQIWADILGRLSTMTAKMMKMFHKNIKTVSNMAQFLIVVVRLPGFACYAYSG